MNKIFLILLVIGLFSCGKDNVTGDNKITNTLNASGVDFTLENKIPVIICLNNNMTNKEKADRLDQYINEFIKSQNPSNPAPVYIQGQAINPEVYIQMIGKAIYKLHDPRITNQKICPNRILSRY